MWVDLPPTFPYPLFRINNYSGCFNLCNFKKNIWNCTSLHSTAFNPLVLVWVDAPEVQWLPISGRCPQWQPARPWLQHYHCLTLHWYMATSVPKYKLWDMFLWQETPLSARRKMSTTSSSQIQGYQLVGEPISLIYCIKYSNGVRCW